MSTATEDRVTQLRKDIANCHAMHAFHTATGNHAAAANWVARRREYTDELTRLEES